MDCEFKGERVSISDYAFYPIPSADLKNIYGNQINFRYHETTHTHYHKAFLGDCCEIITYTKFRKSVYKQLKKYFNNDIFSIITKFYIPVDDWAFQGLTPPGWNRPMKPKIDIEYTLLKRIFSDDIDGSEPDLCDNTDIIDVILDKFQINHKMRFSYHCHFGNYTLTLWSSCLYVITDNDTNKVLAFFYEDTYTFEEGDDKTKIYLFENGNLLIENTGDVESLIFIKYLNNICLNDKKVSHQSMEEAILSDHYDCAKRFLKQFTDEDIKNEICKYVLSVDEATDKSVKMFDFLVSNLTPGLKKESIKNSDNLHDKIKYFQEMRWLVHNVFMSEDTRLIEIIHKHGIKLVSFGEGGGNINDAINVQSSEVIREVIKYYPSLLENSNLGEVVYYKLYHIIEEILRDPHKEEVEQIHSSIDWNNLILDLSKYNDDDKIMDFLIRWFNDKFCDHKDYSFDEFKIIEEVLKKGNLKFLKILIERFNFSVDRKSYENAIKYKSFDCIKYMISCWEEEKIKSPKFSQRVLKIHKLEDMCQNNMSSEMTKLLIEFLMETDDFDNYYEYY